MLTSLKTKPIASYNSTFLFYFTIFCCLYIGPRMGQTNFTNTKNNNKACCKSRLDEHHYLARVVFSLLGSYYAS